MTKTSIVLCFGCFIVNIYAQYSGTGDYEICSTPKRELGQCIGIRQCPELLYLLEKRPLSAESSDYLKISHCGFEGLQPKVCCALKSDTGVTQPTVSVSKHPSIDKGTNYESATSDTGVTQPTVSVSKQPSIDEDTKHESVTSDLLPSTDVCGFFTHQDRIGAGKARAKDLHLPWMALIEYQKPEGRGYHCVGVLISELYVLTAAHCVLSFSPDWILSSVRLGEYNSNTFADCANFTESTRDYCTDAPINVPIVKNITHEDYVGSSINQYHDIALLRLARKVSFTDYVKPICLPITTTSEELNSKYIGANMTVAGWGKTEDGSIGGVKLKVEVPVITNSECYDKYIRTVGLKLGAGQICAGALKGTGLCEYDNGCPLMGIDVPPAGLAWYVTGVLCIGASLEGGPVVYTRVSEYVPWIVSHLKP